MLLQADWSRAPLAVEEMLRHGSPVQSTKPRYARADMSFAGVELKKGDMVLGFLASANADPAVFEAPERFDITRAPNRHLGFGGGVHLCLGLQLARAEALVGLERLMSRWPRMKLAAPADSLRWSGRFGTRGLAALPIDTGVPIARARRAA